MKYDMFSMILFGGIKPKLIHFFPHHALQQMIMFVAIQSRTINKVQITLLEHKDNSPQIKIKHGIRECQ